MLRVRKIFKDYFTFLPKRFLIYEIIGAVIILIISLIGRILVASLPQIVGALLLIYLMLLSIIDYFCFGGLGVKGSHLMEFVRSSPYGNRFIRNAILAQSIFHIVLVLLVSVGNLEIVNLLVGGHNGLTLLVSGLAMAFAAITLLAVSLLVTRKLARSWAEHIGWSYMIMVVGMILLLPIIFLLGSSVALVIDIVVMAVEFVLAVLFETLLISSGKKSFLRGYRDKE